MIDLKQLDLEYSKYKKIRNLYIKYKNELEKFNKKNTKELNSLLITYKSIKNIERNSSRQDTTADELLANLRIENPLFEQWYELDRTVKNYQNQLQQYSSNTYALMECSRVICLKHKEDDGFDLFDLFTHDKLDLSQYDNDKQQYIINDLKSHHSFICNITQEDFPILMQVYKEVDKEIFYSDTDTEDEMEQKFWEEITRCYIIEKEFEKRKNSIQLKEINNIRHESKLVELLGYNLIGPDKSNRWQIVDENYNQVGFIQYKKLFNKNDKKGYPATFGYCMKIDSKKISYESIRKINDSKCGFTSNTFFSYEFDIKRENGDLDHVEISIDELPHLTVWSKKYGFIDFKVDMDGLFLNFKSKTDSFNIEELVIFRFNEENRHRPLYKNEYVYQIKYCDKELELSDDNPKGTTIREISGTYNQYYQNPNQLSLKERTWINGKLRTNRESKVIGTIEEMARKHQMGIDSFNHFRFLINQILPLKQDIVSAMLSNEVIKEHRLSLFVPEREIDNIERETILIKKK